MKKNLIIALVIALCVLGWRVHSYTQNIITHGTVTKLTPYTDSEGSTTYSMSVAYMDHNDNTHEYEQGWNTSVQAYDVGDKVVVEYDRTNTYDAAVVYMMPWNSWGIAWAALLAAAVFALTPWFARTPIQMQDQKIQRARELHDARHNTFYRSRKK